MAERKSRCPECLMPLSECLGHDDDDPLFPPPARCRFCEDPVSLGPRGWHDEGDSSPVGYGCPDAPLGWHEI